MAAMVRAVDGSTNVAKTPEDRRARMEETRARREAKMGVQTVVREKNRGVFPKMTREERQKLLGIFEESGHWNIDFIVMMGLATALAAMGLINNSAPAVIGAMLVAPLMSPLLGGGFALTQGNVVLFRNCIKAMAFGTVVSLLVSAFIGFVTPVSDLSNEIEARGHVNLLDLGIALVSGMAAAYAIGRPALAAILSGVAIAAALVPPVTVVGIAAAKAEWQLSGFSAVLYLTNLVAIILGAAIAFRVLGVRGRNVESRLPIWARRSGLLLTLATVTLIVPLGMRLEAQLELGQNRAVFLPIPTEAVIDVHALLDQEQGMELFSARRHALLPEAGAHVFLATDRAVPDGLVPNIEKAVQRVMGEDMPVRVIAFQVAVGSPLAPALTEEMVEELDE